MARTHRTDALRPLLCSVLIGLFASLALPAAAQWKWRDGDGRIQYSDRPPPPGIPARDVLSKPAATAPMSARPAPATPASAGDASATGAGAVAGSPASGPANVDPELLARKKAAEAAERKAEDERLARERQASCTRARDYLRVLETGVPLARVNERGERESVPAAERDAEVRRAREIVTADCR
jgi:hypothetical protein